MDLDFSDFSDDQLIGLIRAALQECVRRNPAVANAARAATLDEAEKAKVFAAAADREAAKLRAVERERVAKEATEAVRRAAESQQAIDRSARIAKDAEEAVAKEAAREAVFRAILAQASALIGAQPAEISVLVMDNDARYGGGKRVLVNRGGRYSRDHAADYFCDKIKTDRGLVGRKPELIRFCATLAAEWKNLTVLGENYAWPEKESANVQ